jgi:ABC-type oligopeptide transport system substrate-binding subunit
MKRFALAAFAVTLACAATAQAPNASRTLRVQMLGDVETLDPARAPELGTSNSIAPLFHQLLAYDYGSRPVQLIPYAAAALPQISADRRTTSSRCSLDCSSLRTRHSAASRESLLPRTSSTAGSGARILRTRR